MKIRIAEKAGFCMGVRRAVNLVLRAVNQGQRPIYTFGPLIHNPQTLELLTKLGVRAIKSAKDGEPGGICVIRAHGIPPLEKETLRERFKLIDGTCPRVLKVQALAEKAVKEGKQVIIIGDRDHAEVKGILGYCQGKGSVVSSLADIKSLPELDDLVVLSQTTQDEEVLEFLAQKLKERFKKVEVINTICNATEVRQAGVRKLCETSSAIVVVGGRFSANTNRLAQIASAQGKPVYFVEKPEELPHQEIKEFPSLGITAGASTPNWLINSVVDRIKQETSMVYRLLRSLSLSQVYAGLFIPLLILALLLLPKAPLSASSLCFLLYALTFSTFLVLLRNFLSWESFQFFYPERANFYQKKGTVYFLLILFFLTALVSGLLYKPRIMSYLIIFPLLIFLLRQSPFETLLDVLFYAGLVLYLYPFWSDQFLLLALQGMLVLIFVKLYLEMVYLQTDGFLPKSFILSFFNFEEKRVRSFLKALLLILTALPGFATLMGLVNLIFFLPVAGCFILYHTLLMRKLGQTVYLELLSLLPIFLFLFSALAFKLWS